MPSRLETHALLNAADAASAKRVFDSVWAQDFYDGIETGLAVSSDDQYYRIKSIGNSRSGMFRAFVFTHLPNFNASPEQHPIASSDQTRFAFFDDEIWEYARAAAHGQDFVAIGDAYLSRNVCGLLHAQMPTTFAAAHRFLRTKFRPWRS